MLPSEPPPPGKNAGVTTIKPRNDALTRDITPTTELITITT